MSDGKTYCTDCGKVSESCVCPPAPPTKAEEGKCDHSCDMIRKDESWYCERCGDTFSLVPEWLANITPAPARVPEARENWRDYPDEEPKAGECQRHGPELRDPTCPNCVPKAGEQGTEKWTLEQAQDSFSRLVGAAFNDKSKERPRLSIPANEKRDDDVIVARYIMQTASALSACEEKLRKAEEKSGVLYDAQEQVIDALRTEHERLAKMLQSEQIALAASEAKLAQAEERAKLCDEKWGEAVEDWHDLNGRFVDAEARLAEAVGLLDRWRQRVGSVSPLELETDAFLSRLAARPAQKEEGK